MCDLDIQGKISHLKTIVRIPLKNKKNEVLEHGQISTYSVCGNSSATFSPQTWMTVICPVLCRCCRPTQIKHNIALTKVRWQRPGWPQTHYASKDPKFLMLLSPPALCWITECNTMPGRNLGLCVWWASTLPMETHSDILKSVVLKIWKGNWTGVDIHHHLQIQAHPRS